MISLSYCPDDLKISWSVIIGEVWECYFNENYSQYSPLSRDSGSLLALEKGRNYLVAEYLTYASASQLINWLLHLHFCVGLPAGTLALVDRCSK